MDQLGHKQADRVNKDDCCFSHIIGLPIKDRARRPLFDYKRILYNALLRPSYLNNKPASRYPFKAKHLWVKKATGLGVTEFMLRFIYAFF